MNVLKRSLNMETSYKPIMNDVKIIENVASPMFLEYVRFFVGCQISYERFSGFEAKFELIFNKRGV